ncbi:MAG: ferrous iron transport protein B [Bacteroidales bacterium]
MTLDQLQEGQFALIRKVKGRGAFRHRIVEMGFVKGQVLSTLRFAPMKDPVEFRLLDSDVSLRRSEAALIEIDLLEGLDSHTYNGNHINVEDRSQSVYVDKPHLSQAHPLNLKHNLIEVCMVGNPNAGKTSLFNALSGAYEHVGNYSGVTVDAKTTHFFYKGYTIELTDLPGSYSLSPYTPEEKFVREQLLQKNPDVIINVVDASNLERNLYLTSQLIDMDVKVVMALNMYDEMSKKGDVIQIDVLGQLLGIPIVPTVASKEQGSDMLLQKVVDVYLEQEPTIRHIHIPYGRRIEDSLKPIQDAIRKDEGFVDAYPSRFMALKLLENDAELINQMCHLQNQAQIEKLAQIERQKIQSFYNEEPDHILTDDRYAFIRGALKECYQRKTSLVKNVSLTDKIDAILTSKIWGFPIFLFFLWLMFESTFFLGDYPLQWIESGVAAFSNYLELHLTEGILKDMVIDGIVRGIGGVIIFLPNILILFFFISIMETTGYMSRVAFIMDKLMHTIGLHGKSFIPLIIGFGCNVPAIMSTRTIENKKDRLLTMLIIPFMSCSARLPVYILVVGAFFPKNAGTIIFLIYLIGIMFSILSALLFKGLFFKKAESPFVIEFPPYRWPTFKAVAFHLWFKTKQYLQKMAGIILIASIVIWALSYFPTSSHVFGDAQIEHSYLGTVGKIFEPIIAPLGFDWKMGISLLAGISAKEVVVSTMSVLMDVNTAFTPLSAVSFLIFVLLYFPCIAVFAAIKKESKSWKWAIFMALYTTILAWIIAFAIYQIGSLFI